MLSLFLPSTTCPTCCGARSIVMNSFGFGGKKLVARKCPGCRGKGTLKRR